MASIKPITVPTKRLASSLIGSSLAFSVNNITGWGGDDLIDTDFGSRALAVLRNTDNTLIEIIEFDPATIADPSITILQRGLAFDGSDVSVSANKLTWLRNDTLVEFGTDVPQMLAHYVTDLGDHSITGKYTFADSDVTRPRITTDVDTAVSTAFVTLGQLSRQAISGASNASTTTKGIVELATQAETDARSTTGSTGALLAVTPDALRSTKLSDYVASDTGSANAYVIAPSPVFTTYAAGQRYIFKAANANTGISTVNVSTLGVKTIKKNGSLNLAAGDILAGQIVELMYDAVGDVMHMLTPASLPFVPTGVYFPYGGITAPTGFLMCDGSAVSRTTYLDLFSALNPSIGTVTVTIASPAVFSFVAHGLKEGDTIYFTTTGALPTNLAINTVYYVIATGLGADVFRVSATRGGSVINTTGTQSGVHTLRRSPYGIGDGSTTFNVPNMSGKTFVGRDAADPVFAIGEAAGEKTHILTIAEMPAHTHPDANYQVGSGGALSGNVFTTSSNTASSRSVPSQGGDGAHNNLQPYLTGNVIIKT